MKKKNKLFLFIFLLIILLIICKNLFSFKTINYNIKTESYKVKVIETKNSNGFYIKIQTNDNEYPFRIYNSSIKNRKIVKGVYAYKDDEIECILPTINDEIVTDIVCYKDKALYNYIDIIGLNRSLDKYVDSIEGYDIKNFQNNIELSKNIKTIKYNKLNNFNKIIAISTYKGLVINNKEIDIFNKDVYNNKLSAFIDKYYIVADYSNTYTFNYFYIIDITNGEIKKLKAKEDISYDSYIQGIVDNKLYLYDTDNENQYEIDVLKKDIKIISSKDYVKYYSNNKWQKINKAKANKIVYFDFNSLDNIFTMYDCVKETEDFYYLFKQDGISYKLYRVDKENIDIYKFLTDVPVTSIKFNKDYLYYTYKNKLFYYSDSTGLKVILENSELEFNETIKYYIY